MFLQSRGMKASAAAVCALWVAGCGSNDLTGDVKASDPYLADSAHGVYTLSGYEPGLPADDLAPLVEAVADAEVVGLGEPVHASTAFIGLKLRLAKDLIERRDFRVIAWETSRAGARQLNEYVQTCLGDPNSAVHALGDDWADVQTSEFAAWLCAWNASHPYHTVQVQGFDVQDPNADLAELETYFGRVAPERAQSFLSELGPCDDGMEPDADDDHQSCKAGTGQLRAELEGRAEELAAIAGPQALASVLIALASFEAWQDIVFATEPSASLEARDVGMANVLEGLRRRYFPAQKALVFAHNLDVVKRHDTVTESWVGAPIVTLGTLLDLHLGENYRAIAMVGWEVSSDGVDSTAPSPRSLEAYLHESAASTLFVDLHGANVGAAILENVPYEMGAPRVEVNVPAEHYDGVLYVEHSPAATPVH